MEAQRKWDGEARDGQWSNPLNWVGDTLPVVTDDVVFDNLYLDSSYSVYLPIGSGQLMLHSMEIQPMAGRFIKVEIPPGNLAVPALSLTREFNSLVLHSNAVFVNASGAAAGSTIELADSLVIRNGARYVHHTPRSHATLVSLLSRAPGTEEGIFEFDVPDASVTISLSDRIFGKLILNATAANGSINYTAAGTRPLKVRSDFIVGKGVKLNLNFSDTFHLLGNYVQYASTVNLSTTTRSLTFMVKRNVFMDTGAVMLSTGTGQPSLLLSGNLLQLVNIRGEIKKDISIILLNPSGIRLEKPLNIAAGFYMKEGIVYSDEVNVLRIDTTGILLADSMNIDTYVDGPIYLARNIKEQHTLLPVGDAGEIHWIALKNWEGNCLVSYKQEDPHKLSSNISGVDHISTHGYWVVSMKPGTQAGLQISFNDANAAGVTEMNSLAISRLSDSLWTDIGSTGYTGSAGSNGSVIGKELLFSEAPEYFTFGSLVKGQNPLPIDTTRQRFRMQREYMAKGTSIEKVLKNGAAYQLLIRSDKKQRMQLMIINSLNQLIDCGTYMLEPGKNVLNYFPGNLQFGLIHFFGLFSNYRTNTVSIW